MTDDTRIAALLDYRDEVWPSIASATVIGRARRMRRRRIAAATSSLVAAALAVTLIAVQPWDTNGVSTRHVEVTAAQIAQVTKGHEPFAPPVTFDSFDGITPVAWVTVNDELCSGYVSDHGSIAQCSGWGPPGDDVVVLAGKPIIQATGTDSYPLVGFVTGDVVGIDVLVYGSEHYFTTTVSVLASAADGRSCGAGCTQPALKAYAVWVPRQSRDIVQDDITSVTATDATGKVVQTLTNASGAQVKSSQSPVHK